MGEPARRAQGRAHRRHRPLRDDPDRRPRRAAAGPRRDLRGRGVRPRGRHRPLDRPRRRPARGRRGGRHAGDRPCLLPLQRLGRPGRGPRRLPEHRRPARLRPGRDPLPRAGRSRADPGGREAASRAPGRARRRPATRRRRSAMASATAGAWSSCRKCLAADDASPRWRAPLRRHVDGPRPAPDPDRPRGSSPASPHRSVPRCRTAPSPRSARSRERSSGTHLPPPSRWSRAKWASTSCAGVAERSPIPCM